MLHTATAPTWGFDVALTPPALARAFVGAGHPHETIAVPGVVLAAGEALVRVELSTICGSDVHTWSGHRSAPVPTVLGHEYVGRVMQLGDDSVTYVDGSRVRIGDRVVWSIFAACRACDRCLRGIPQKCRELRKYGHERIASKWELSGGFATHVHLVRGTAIVRAPENLPAEVLAPATCGTATAWAALAAAEDVVEVSSSLVLVSGAGLIGLTATAMATARGARVIVADPDATRRALAPAFGAIGVVNPADRRSLRAALSAEDAVDVDLVIEASGARAAVASALDVVAVAGAVVLVGSVFPTDAIALDPEKVVRSCATIRGVHNYPPAALAAAVSFLATHHSEHPFAQLVGETFALSELDDALAAAAAPGAPVRVGIVS